MNCIWSSEEYRRSDESKREKMRSDFELIIAVATGSKRIVLKEVYCGIGNVIRYKCAPIKFEELFPIEENLDLMRSEKGAVFGVRKSSQEFLGQAVGSHVSFRGADGKTIYDFIELDELYARGAKKNLKKF